MCNIRKARKKCLMMMFCGIFTCSFDAFSYIDFRSSEWGEVKGDPVESYVAVELPLLGDEYGGNDINNIKIITLRADIDGDGDEDLFITNEAAENGRGGNFWRYYIYDSSTASFWTWYEIGEKYVVATATFRTDMLSVGYHEELSGFGMLSMIPAAGGGTVFGLVVDKAEGEALYLREITDIVALDFHPDDPEKSEEGMKYLRDKLKPSGYTTHSFTLSEYKKGVHQDKNREKDSGTDAAPHDSPPHVEPSLDQVQGDEAVDMRPENTTPGIGMSKSGAVKENGDVVSDVSHDNTNDISNDNNLNQIMIYLVLLVVFFVVLAGLYLKKKS